MLLLFIPLFLNLFLTAQSSIFSYKYEEEESKVLSRICGSLVSPDPFVCISNDKIISENAFVLFSSQKTIIELGGDFQTLILNYTSQPGTLIVTHKASSTPVQILNQFLNAKLVVPKEFLNSGNVWDYPMRAQALHSHLVLQHLKKYFASGYFKNVIFTGHSLAGGISILDAYSCISAQICSSHNTKVLTFGTPRTGNYGFAQHYNNVLPNTWRVANENDSILAFPRCGSNGLSNKCRNNKPSETELIFEVDAYYHVGTEIWYKDGTNGTFKTCESFIEDNTCAPRVLPSLLETILNIGKIGIMHTSYFKIDVVVPSAETGCNFV
uniref:Lipase_3 domain-containing protein n=1 Tax=Rhabditophanes sp. KR3021 TaxID=114890 RepID=A0AC35U9M7_9BILA